MAAAGGDTDDSDGEYTSGSQRMDLNGGPVFGSSTYSHQAPLGPIPIYIMNNGCSKQKTVR